MACVSATSAAYHAMIKQHSPDGTRESFTRATRDNPSGKEAAAYRQWVREVLQPLNERAAELIFAHADLIDAPALWPLMLQLVAHVSALKARALPPFCFKGCRHQPGERSPSSFFPGNASPVGARRDDRV